MKQYNDKFKRIEKKYILDRHQYSLLRKCLDNKMADDSYGNYTIGNIYYDTSDYLLIRTSLDKPVYKEKIRLRSYGTPSSNTLVFAEIKKKFDGVVYKRRISLPLKEAKEFLKSHKPCSETPSQIQNEINWVLNFYNPVPKVFIGYDRIALTDKDDSELRITFDSKLRWRTTHVDLEAGTWGSPLINENLIIMEIKIPGTMPVWLSHVLSELKIYPTSFSKYGTCYKKYLYRELLPSLESDCDCISKSSGYPAIVNNRTLDINKEEEALRYA